MIVVIVSMSEAFLTYVALVLLLICVYQFVTFEVEETTEYFLAY